jgi:hypothetical protein
MKRLFGETDRRLGRLRRYDRGELEGKLAAAGFVVEESHYINIAGVFGWYFNSVLLRRPTVGALQARFADLLSPWLSLEERLKPRFGLTLLVVARKRAAMAVVAPSSIKPSPKVAIGNAAN